MKPTRTIFIVLASIWTFFLLIEKLLGTTGSYNNKNSMILIRIARKTMSAFKSILLFCLVIVNVFMAIALIDTKK